MPPGTGTVPLRASGKDIVDVDGNSVHLTGFGLGGWLMHEGYMIGNPGPCGGNGGGLQCATPRFMRANIEAKVGKEQADAFYAEYQKNYVTEADIAQVAQWGFNSVRLPFNANALLPEEGQPPEPPFNYDEAGFAPIDDLVAWAEELGISVPAAKRGTPWAEVLRETRRSRAATGR
jgi:aryl-phospho-beta-D-glucosidase BglC (GH1 family)